MSDTKPKQSSSSSGYAIWLIPSANEKTHYQHLINRLSKLADTDDDEGTRKSSPFPSFEPHITLFAFIPLDTPIGEISNTLRQVVARVAAQVSSSGPERSDTMGTRGAGASASELESCKGLEDFVLGLLPAQSGRSYFQSVLAPVKPSTKLLSLREQTVAAFTPSPSDSDSHSQKRDDYFPHLSLFYGDCTPTKRAEIAAIANSDDPSLGSGRSTVTIKELGIVRCVGKVEEWEHVESVVL
ncbi:hypothetical protein C349_03216 [Cryptococcus neoformans var. grubii Br795]|nr:hypothetical protein C353_03191 [Cryptococcus neoformans var. grubii AD1-83a]OXG42006.1 hypothetical protein C359_02589 [Cryptococcus neoformans var. grubii Bt120]OXG59907.1 hypothetical protein C354_03127 [Cryptococcus neoformans var. grubii MW-RSA1955]OXG63815.1 hypothetical protein C351_02918 [Cryptococcus neoformans var. grubii c8]OXG64867.1 hypothetical protein C352_03136 [Cryptococcus neoformans var. grubii CHC193]OXG82995.1 hypothetical protein C349_03216 [Cryptococcus neoformans var